VSRSLVHSFLVFGLFAAACGPGEVKHPYQADDKTPANSVSETRLNGDDPNKPKAQVTSATKPEDPTQAQVNSVSDMPKADDPPASGKEAAAKPGKPEKPEKAEKSGKPSKTGPKISKAECDKAFEKAMELEIASKPELQGIDKKQLLAMAKQMGSEKHGEAPCDATKSQYTCAMAATTTSQWKRCME
jgi:hypothetical protein